MSLPFPVDEARRAIPQPYAWDDTHYTLIPIEPTKKQYVPRFSRDVDVPGLKPLSQYDVQAIVRIQEGENLRFSYLVKTNRGETVLADPVLFPHMAQVLKKSVPRTDWRKLTLHTTL